MQVVSLSSLTMLIRAVVCTIDPLAAISWQSAHRWPHMWQCMQVGVPVRLLRLPCMLCAQRYSICIFGVSDGSWRGVAGGTLGWVMAYGGAGVVG